MKIVKIEIEDRKLRDLEIEQEPMYVEFYFNESQFIGYWFDGDGKVIHFYIGCQEFLCRNITYNIELFNSILNKNGSN